MFPSIVSPTAAMVTEAEAAADAEGLELTWAACAGAVELAEAGAWPAVVCAADEQAARLIPPTATAATADIRSFTGEIMATSWADSQHPGRYAPNRDQ
ncbi:MAG TPA: hypothetical protein VN847_24765, partial [Streptosporangiaceae bacterium]|nr:hypothetical protein [Streptosporangiaceae bacterium]